MVAWMVAWTVAWTVDLLVAWKDVVRVAATGYLMGYGRAAR